VGKDLARDAADRFHIAGVGEMGIGNTTSAAALLSVFTDRDPDETAGKGAGLSAEGVARKAQVIRDALALHRPDARDPLAVLAAVGGFEIGMIAGFLLGALERRLPVVIDGFITSAGALVATRIDEGVLDCAFFSHVSAERGHRLMLKTLGVRAPLDLGMRLGEGTGAALMIGLVETAVRLYREMATFAEAGVATR
jgi:nicotinate-nucleotide--dimethylbenzimidazole phosphoribosyltransferase